MSLAKNFLFADGRSAILVLLRVDSYGIQSLEMEAEPGIEPGYTDLQSAASPLCHPANFKATHFRCIWILNQVQKVLTLSVSTKKGCGDSLFGEVLR